MPSPHPQAELWLGAHPADPSTLVQPDGSRLSLLDAMTADPDELLGPLRARRWDGTLPYLLKVLAADEPLSLQAHPSLEQARDGFAREEAAGIPRDAADRNYRDANHKPELICALTEFHALVGFREPADSVRLLRALDVPELAGHAELLAGEPNADGLRALFTTWITLPQAVLDTPGARAAGRRGAAGRRARGSSRPRPARCWSCPSATRATPGCWPRCCSTGSPWRRGRRCSCRPATCTPTCPGPGSS